MERVGIPPGERWYLSDERSWRRELKLGSQRHMAIARVPMAAAEEGLRSEWRSVCLVKLLNHAFRRGIVMSLSLARSFVALMASSKRRGRGGIWYSDGIREKRRVTKALIRSGGCIFKVRAMFVRVRSLDSFSRQRIQRYVKRVVVRQCIEPQSISSREANSLKSLYSDQAYKVLDSRSL